MMWIWLSVVIVLLRAAPNAEGAPDAKDSTDGPPRPLGSRGATMVDHVGASHACPSRRDIGFETTLIRRTGYRRRGAVPGLRLREDPTCSIRIMICSGLALHSVRMAEATWLRVTAAELSAS